MTKYSFFIILVIVVLFGCGENERKPEEKTPQDSTAISENILSKEELEKLRKDSIERAEEERIKDSTTKVEQDKVIESIPFYITEKKFIKEKKAFMKKCKLSKPENYKKCTIIENKLGQYGFNNFDSWFYKDSLYSIEFRGCMIEQADYDRVMPDQYKALMDYLKPIYGEPTLDNGFPAYNTIDRGFYRKCAEWVIGDKTIETRITCSMTTYTLNLAIYKPAIAGIAQK